MDIFLFCFDTLNTRLRDLLTSEEDDWLDGMLLMLIGAEMVMPIDFSNVKAILIAAVVGGLLLALPACQPAAESTDPKCPWRITEDLGHATYDWDLGWFASDSLNREVNDIPGAVDPTCACGREGWLYLNHYGNREQALRLLIAAIKEDAQRFCQSGEGR